MSTDDAESPPKENKRIESVNKTKNHNEQKRLKRKREKDAEKRVQLIQLLHANPVLIKQQKVLKAVEAETERHLAQLKQRALTQKLRRDANPSIVTLSNANRSRLTVSEKKDAEEKKRNELEAEEKKVYLCAKKKKHREKKKFNEDEVPVFILRNTTTTNFLHQVESAMNQIIQQSKWENRYPANRLLELNVIDALFACLQRFPKENWFSLLALQVFTGLTRSMYDVNDCRTWLRDGDGLGTLGTLRSTYTQLSNNNACGFVVDLAEKYPNVLDVAQECMEVFFRLIRYHDYTYSTPFYPYVGEFINPNIRDVCLHPRMESLVVQLFNEHESKSTTDVFAQHCLSLIVVFASNDISAAYRPEMCDIVMMSMQKYNDSSVVLSICNAAIAALAKNIENKQKLEEELI